jgi:glycosyltransferase involved in cell wall biosynthesis
VLQLVPRLPYPADDGGKIGILGILNAFLRLGHEVRLGGFDEEGRAAEFGAAVGTRLDRWFCEDIPRRRVWRAKARVAAGIGTYLVDKYWSRSFAAQVLAEYDQWRPDLVHLDHSHMGSYGLFLKSRRPRAVVCMRAHNVESIIWRRRADLAADALRRSVFGRQADLSERAERELFSRMDGIISISRVDTETIRRQAPDARLYEMPAGYEINRAVNQREAIGTDPRLCFVGSLDYTANRDGLGWFIAEIWPELRRSFPKATLAVAGRSATPVDFLQAVPGVTYRGFVADVSEVTDAADIAVVPLRIGGGIRLKILDFLSRGMPVISTAVGAEGTTLEHEGIPVVLVADAPAQFVERLRSLCDSARLRADMARAGRDLILARYDWSPLVAGYLDWATSAGGHRLAQPC